MSTLRKFKQIIVDDLKYKKFKSIYDLASTEDLEAFVEELQLMHKTRSIRSISLDNKVPTGKLLSKTSMQEQSHRSRCVEIVMTLMIRKNNLQRSLKAIQKYLLSSYAVELKEIGCSAARQQQYLVSSAVQFASDKLDQIESVIQLSDLIIQDIDKGSFAIKHSVESLVVATKREVSY